MNYTIEAERLRKTFGATQPLDGVDLAARTGSVLGPNGAGKHADDHAGTLAGRDEFARCTPEYFALMTGHDCRLEG